MLTVRETVRQAGRQAGRRTDRQIPNRSLRACAQEDYKLMLALCGADDPDHGLGASDPDSSAGLAAAGN